MKRILKGLILAFVGVFGLTLASCGEETKLPTEQTPQTPVHEHTTGEGWKRDSATHWQECSGCDELVNVAVHDYNEFTLATDKCVKTRDCKVCGYTETRDVDHTWKDGVCTVCGEELLITQYYVRGSFGGSDWPALDEYKLAIDYGTASATITVTLTAGDEFKVADSKWSAEFNAKTIKAAEGLFDGDNNIIVKTTAEYKIVLTKLDTTAPECEITQLCVHTFGEWTLVPGKTCEKTATCTKCNAVSTKVEHAGYGEWTLVEGKTCDWESVCACGDKKTEVRHTWGDDIVCDKCQAVNVLQFYVRGDMNGWDTSTALVLGADKKSASVLLVVEAGQCFKIATEDWKNEFNFNTITFNVNGFEAKAADASDVKATKDGVYMVNVSGLDTLEPTCTIDPIQLYVRGDMNGWGTDAKYALVYDKATDTSTFTLELADVTQGFKIASPEWDVYNKHYNIGALGDGKYGYGTAEADAGNIKFTETGFYVITITGVTTGDPVVKIEKGTGEVKPVVTPVPDLYVVGSHNGWGDAFVDANKLTVNAEADTATIEVALAAGTEFKVSDSTWACQYGFGATGLTYAEGLFTDAGGNLKVAKTGLYKVVVAGLADKAKSTCTITLEKGESTIEAVKALTEDTRVFVSGTVVFEDGKYAISDGENTLVLHNIHACVGDEITVYAKYSKQYGNLESFQLIHVVKDNSEEVELALTGITSVEQLVDGAQIAIGGGKELLSAAGKDFRYSAPINCSCNQLITLVKSNNNWLLKVGENQYLYATDANKLWTGESVESDAQWTISITDGVVTITNVKFPERMLQYNASSSRFAAYKASSKQAAPKLYLAKVKGIEAGSIILNEIKDAAEAADFVDKIALNDVEGYESKFDFTNDVILRVNDDKTKYTRLELNKNGAGVISFDTSAKITLTITLKGTGDSNTCVFAVSVNGKNIVANEQAVAMECTKKDTTEAEQTAGVLYSYTESATVIDSKGNEKAGATTENMFATYGADEVTVTFTIDGAALPTGAHVEIYSPACIQGRGIGVTSLTVEPVTAE